MRATAICHALSQRLPRKWGWGQAGTENGGLRISKPLSSAHLQSGGRKTRSNCVQRKTFVKGHRFHFPCELICFQEMGGCLENPRDGGAWWAAVYGVSQSRTRLKWLSSSSMCWGKSLGLVWVQQEPLEGLELKTNMSNWCFENTWLRTSLVVQWIGVHCQWRGHMFNSWSGKIPCATCN